MRHSIVRLSPLVLLVLATACQADLKCGPLEVDWERRVCVCPNGGDHREGLCYLDGSVTPLDGMVLGDAGPMPDDGGPEEPPDAHRPDAGTDAGPPDACTPTTYYADSDGDGFGDRTTTMSACERPDGYVEDDTDCDDACEDCTPEGTEVCDAEARDEDCDGMPNGGCACTEGSDPIECGTTDEGECSLGLQHCVDGSYGTCEGAIGPVDEICNGLDDDCDGSTDETVRTTFYRDADGDGRGDAAVTMQACSAPSGYVTSSNDCDDTCATCYPGRSEVCDGENNDCDADVDEGVRTRFYRDADGDGRGNAATFIDACTAPTGYVASSTDCNDSCPTCYPGRTEVCDGENNDCDAGTDEGVLITFYRDADNDTYGDQSMPSTPSCTAPAGYVANDDDCNDSCMSCHPGGTEVCDGLDNDCDEAPDDGVPLTTYYRDCDGDGYAASFTGSVSQCSAPTEPPGSCADPAAEWTTTAPTSGAADCRDTNDLVFPGQPAFFPDPIAGTSSYDYDCDGTPEPEIVGRGYCAELGGGPCVRVYGWNRALSGTDPTCGGDGEVVTSCGGGCVTITTARRQGCH